MPSIGPEPDQKRTVDMNWDWTAIEAISSVIGVVGVVLSVIFLAYEVRHNAKAIEGATVQSLMSLEREVFTLLADNAELFITGCKDIASLSESDRFRFDRISSAQMSLIYSAYVQFENELIDEETWVAYVNAAKRYMAHPGFRESWQSYSTGYPASFGQAIAHL